MKIAVKLSQSQLRQDAMVAQGLDPQLMAMRRGTQVQRNRKTASKGGYSKHKNRSYE